MGTGGYVEEGVPSQPHSDLSNDQHGPTVITVLGWGHHERENSSQPHLLLWEELKNSAKSNFATIG